MVVDTVERLETLLELEDQISNAREGLQTLQQTGGLDQTRTVIAAIYHGRIAQATGAIIDLARGSARQEEHHQRK